jgi:3-isopropylmalate/(R)-2-methylmalate dehydratase small subunit
MIEGRCWLFGDDINTDVMMPGDVLYSSEAAQTKALFRDVRPRWLDEIGPGDILIAGRNFGLGSSRPAARSLVNVGISLLIAESISSLFFRGCVSYGLAAMTCPGITEHAREGDVLRADPRTGDVLNITTGTAISGHAVPTDLLATMRAGGTLPMLEARGLISPPVTP